MTTFQAVRASRILLSFVLSFLGANGTAAQVHPGAPTSDLISVSSGSGSFVVEGGQGREEKGITVFYHKPENFDRGAPVLMVIPGAGRNGDDYRDAWVEASETYGVLVLSPSYPEKHYPEFWSYNLAGMTREVTLDLSFVVDTEPRERPLDEVREEIEATIAWHELVGDGAAHQLIYQLVLFSKAGMIKGVDIRGTNSVANANLQEWIFDDFDRIFEAVRDELELETETYDLFGHSAGGQILHRFALFHPTERAGQIVAANSGWYTVPTFEQEFPYGLKDSGMTINHLEAAFGSRLVVFLGEEDDADETRGSLRRTSQTEQQGSGRLERGKHFFGMAQEAATDLGVDLEWRIEIVPGIGHDYSRMGEAAAEYLYGSDVSR